ncbi:hypothetical protein FBQ82_18935 [Anaerolineae bacterium CFX7]|nr:hypothetical protein [Anaerolineae bacterium CFX7]
MKLMLRVQLVIAEEPKKALPNVKVSLYDRDWKSEDDLLGTEVTDAKGEIFFEFDEKKYKDAEDGPDWRIESLPDLYVNIYDVQDQVVYSTRDVVERDKFPKLLVVPIPRAVVEQHKLG